MFSSGKDFIYPKGMCSNQACSNQWCPGMPLPCGSDCTGHPQYPNWNMNVCHDFMVGTKRPDSAAYRGSEIRRPRITSARDTYELRSQPEGADEIH
jgi:hypothetical protein